MRFCCLPCGGAQIPCPLDAHPLASCASRRPCPHTLLFAREEGKHISSLYSNQYSGNLTLDGYLRVGNACVPCLGTELVRPSTPAVVT